MMDTQRLIAFVVFSFSALLLWDAWQKHTGPKPPLPVTATAPAGVPQPSAPLAGPGAPTPPSATATPAATPAAPSSPVVSGGEPITVRTDLFDVELSTLGGDIRRLTLRQVHSAQDRSKPLTLMEPDAKHYYVTQSGLLGDGLPNHKAVYAADARAYELGSGKHTLE